MYGFPDDSISPIMSQMVGASRLRSPARLQHECRYGDSRRSGSAPRSSSGPKSRIYACAVDESNISCHRGRYVGKRKERRWGNDLLFGLDVDFESNQLCSNWQRSFMKLFRDATVTEMFRTCADGLATNPVKVEHAAVKSELAKASDAWNNIEGRLRGLVVKILDKSDAMKKIGLYLESIVVCYKHEVLVGDDTSDGKVWKAPFTGTDGSVELLQSVLQSNVHYTTGPMSSTFHSLAIPLVDNASYRLLLHTICQYHGLKSQTINVGNAKVTLVSRCRQYAVSLDSSSKSDELSANDSSRADASWEWVEECHISHGKLTQDIHPSTTAVPHLQGSSVIEHPVIKQQGSSVNDATGSRC